MEDVLAWLDFIGMDQYRQRFTHHCITGRLLLSIKDEQLKWEVGIGPLGHRAAILESIADLAMWAAQTDLQIMADRAGDAEAVSMSFDEGDGLQGVQQAAHAAHDAYASREGSRVPSRAPSQVCMLGSVSYVAAPFT